MAAFKLRRADLYPDDWLAGTLRLSLEERGAYITICALIYSHGGPILDDDRWLAGTCRVSTRKWRKIRGALVDAEKITIDGGLIRQRRCEYEIEKAQIIAGKRSESGSKGGSKLKRNFSELEPQPSKNNGLGKANAHLRARVPSTLLPFSGTDVPAQGAISSDESHLEKPRAVASVNPAEVVFSTCRLLLTDRYAFDDGKARRFLGALRKEHGDPEIITAFTRLQDKPDVQDPVPWLKASLATGRPNAGNGSARPTAPAIGTAEAEQRARDWGYR